jgi:uncharacterized membrane protein YidH (DUF202 family)
MKDEQAINGDYKHEDDPRVDLAVERTIYAIERTQLSWVRTVLGFITGGIALDKGMSALHQARVVSGVAWEKNGHFGGLLLTSGGTLLMVISTIFYIIRIWQLTTTLGRKNKLLSPGTLVSAFMVIVGVLSVYFLTIPW